MSDGRNEAFRAYQDARNQWNAYFEKLAILDGGTVALVVSAVLGPFHGQIAHKYLVGVGLSMLVLAMLLLLRRNYQAVQIEFYATAHNFDPLVPVSGPHFQSINKQVHYTEATGLILSGLGILLLLVEVWLIL